MNEDGKAVVCILATTIFIFVLGAIAGYHIAEDIRCKQLNKQYCVDLINRR